MILDKKQHEPKLLPYAPLSLGRTTGTSNCYACTWLKYFTWFSICFITDTVLVECR